MENGANKLGLGGILTVKKISRLAVPPRKGPFLSNYELVELVCIGFLTPRAGAHVKMHQLASTLLHKLLRLVRTLLKWKAQGVSPIQCPTQIRPISISMIGTSLSWII